MSSERATARVVIPGTRTARSTETYYAEGITAGLLGGAMIAAWFFVVDFVSGRPLHTPTVLGTALFRGGEGLESPGAIPASFEMVFMFTWVHFLVFGVLGGLFARLLAVAETNPNAGFGVVLLFVYLESAFLIGSFLFAESVLHAIAWPAVLVGNLLAALAMIAFFWRKHPNLRIRP